MYLFLLAELTLDWFGVHIEKGFTLAFVIFAFLMLFQTVIPRIELNKFLISRPRIIVKKAYSKKKVLTTDFVITDP